MDTIGINSYKVGQKGYDYMRRRNEECENLKKKKHKLLINR